MAPRKDMMRVIRRDAGFSAKLGFGESEGADTAVAAAPAPTPDKTKPAAPVRVEASASDGVEASAEMKASNAEKPSPSNSARLAKPRLAPDKARGTRGSVVYVAVSLTEAQAERAEAWADAARCSVPFLIRKVAQGLRTAICEDWQEGGMPAVIEQRGTRGRFPTSVTLTLPPGFAADLAARHDPLGLQGLGRTIGPAFRARFEAAFDTALCTAGFEQDAEGDLQ